MRYGLPRSLRARLALWYLIVLGLVLVIFGCGIYLEVRRSLLDGADAALSSRAASVLGQVSSGGRGLIYRGGDAPSANAEMAVYLFASHGRLLHRVAGSTELSPLPAALRPALAGGESYSTVNGLRLYMVGLRDGQGRLYGAIQVIQSLDAVQEILSKLLALLVLAIPALLLVATAGGIFLAGRALAPIDRMARTARQIGAGNLSGRLALTPRDDEMGRLAATFDDMLDRLERAFAQQRQFAADASHELRTPLAIARSDLDILRRRPRSIAEHEEFERGLNEELSRLSTLVEDLLTLARADSGQVELEREFVYLDTLIENAVQGLRRLATARGVTLETRLQAEMTLPGDPTRLRQLVINLVDNAIRYTPHGGRILVTLNGQGPRASLVIADTGIGIAPDDLPHVFDRFFRANTARGGPEGGTGLGLPIARWCAEAHGGSIAVESTPGVGSTFTVSLPRMLPDQELSGSITRTPQPAAECVGPESNR